MSSPFLFCHVLTQESVALAQRLQQILQQSPWPLASELRCTAPRRFAPSGMLAWDSLRHFLQNNFHSARAHIFLGATGIAVRCLAPLLTHKKDDPAVIVIDPRGHFVISLLSGHWGGANELARHIACLLHAVPVITTASDTLQCPALDLLAQQAQLVILDWDQLPRIQAMLLEKQPLPLFDPEQLLTALPEACCRRVASLENLPPDMPQASVHWKAVPPAAQRLRLCVPRLVVGLGCKKNIPLQLAHAAILELWHTEEFAPEALAALATVEDKASEPALCHAARQFHLPLRTFTAAQLARQTTPTPSSAAGQRFSQPPFSVCEAAALLAAGSGARLLVSKRKIAHQLTLAVALAARPLQPLP